MIIRKTITIILLLNLFLNADYKQTITWDIPIEPPITYIKNNEYLGYGISIMKSIQSFMPEYNHQIRVAGNYKRLSLNVKEGPLTCALGLFKTEERLKYMHFTQVPVFSFFDLQIVLSMDTFNKLGKPKVLSLEKLLHEKGFKLGVSHGRTYSKKVRDILDENKDNLNIKTYAQSNVTNSLLKMLVRARFDYMFLYPDEAMYYSKDFKISKKIVTVPILENKDYGYSWLSCTKNDKGKIAVSKISDILLTIRKENKYMNFYIDNISSNLHEYYKNNFQDNFLKIFEE